MFNLDIESKDKRKLFVVEILQQHTNFQTFFLEYDSIFDEPYATTIGELHEGKISISYTKVKSIYYQTLSKTDTTQKIEAYKLCVC